MKTTLASALRTAAFAATVLLFPLVASATETTAADRAAHLLASRGTIPVQAAGPYVEVGTYRIQVAVKLGRPTTRLDDSTWLYENFRVEDSTALGTLVVRFDHGRVASLSLASPTVVAALRTTRPVGTLLASQDRR